MIRITTKARTVLQALNTPEIRVKASEIARNHGLLNGTTVHSLGLAHLLKEEEITETSQEFYAQELIAFYDYATAKYHTGTSISMWDNFIHGKRIFWDSYK